MMLETCCGCSQRKPVDLMPHVGLFCDECREVLSRPFSLEGLIQSQSIALLSEETQREFHERAAKLRRMALQLIENERVSSAR